ncbi:MAG: hypothetical protein HY649_09380 [Acidobacteria bacterium]|nr:hypothetical protein [Acidobacteriota bacterium]
MFRGKVKFGWAIFFIVSSCFVLGHAEPQSAPAASSDAHVAREIEAAEVSFTAALTTVDLPKLDHLLTEDFTWTTPAET